MDNSKFGACSIFSCLSLATNMQGGGIQSPQIFICIFVCEPQFSLNFPKILFRMFIGFFFGVTCPEAAMEGWFRINVRPKLEKYKLLYAGNCHHLSNFSDEISSLKHLIASHITILAKFVPCYVISGPQNGQKYFLPFLTILIPLHII